MTLALAGRAPATFEIKSANLPLVALLLKSPDLTRLGEELAAQFGDTPDFFDHDPLVIDLGPLQEQPAADVDFPALAKLLRRYRVMPVAVKGGSESQMAAALKAGLAPAADLQATSPERATPAAAAAAPVLTQAVPVAVPTTAMLVTRPLRSGQQVYARGRDLVVMAMVNPGAEVIADGNIHVYAPLRGKAIAGARGDSDARILTLCLEAELVSIAGVYRTSEVPLPKELQGKPAQIRLDGGSEGKLVIESLNP